MGLGIKVLVRHPRGEEDLMCPSAWCDVCGEELNDDPQDGFTDVYAYVPPPRGTGEATAFFNGETHVPMRLVHGGRCYESLSDENGLALPHMPTNWLIVGLASNICGTNDKKTWGKLWDHVTNFGL